MKKINLFIFVIFIALWSDEAFAQFANDGSYLWNSASITYYSPNDKTEVYFGNKDHFSNQIKRLDYYHFEVIGYHKLSKRFSLGIGVRQTENYKSEDWNPGQTYMFYGVYVWNPWNIRIKFANRLMAKTYKTSETNYGLDNVSNVDFFAHSTSLWPKPYLMDELFSSLDLLQLQTIRIYTGLHLFNKQYWGIDLYYCYWKACSTADWNNYNVLGLSTKIKI